MRKIHAYLNFNGQCEEAFRFYEKAFDTQITSVYKFGDMPPDPQYPMKEEDKGKIMHISMPLNDSVLLMGSDCLESFGQKATSGNNTYIMIDVDNAEDAKKYYERLTAHISHIEMPLSEQFYAELYASFTDQFGISWMIYYEGKKAENFQ